MGLGRISSFLLILGTSINFSDGPLHEMQNWFIWLTLSDFKMMYPMTKKSYFVLFAKMDINIKAQKKKAYIHSVLTQWPDVRTHSRYGRDCRHWQCSSHSGRCPDLAVKLSGTVHEPRRRRYPRGGTWNIPLSGHTPSLGWGRHGRRWCWLRCWSWRCWSGQRRMPRICLCVQPSQTESSLGYLENQLIKYMKNIISQFD